MLLEVLRHSAQMLEVSQAIYDERAQRLAASQAPLVAWEKHARDVAALNVSVGEAIAQQLEAQNVEFARALEAMLERHAAVVAESEASALSLLGELAQTGRLLPNEVEKYAEQIRKPLEQLLKQPRSAWTAQVSSETAVDAGEGDAPTSRAPADETAAYDAGMDAAGADDAFRDSRSGGPADDGALGSSGAGDFLDRPEQTVSELFALLRASSGSGGDTPASGRPIGAATPPAAAAAEALLYESNGEMNQAAYRALIDGALGRQLTPLSSAHGGSSATDSDGSSAAGARRTLEDSAAQSVEETSVDDYWGARRSSGRSGRRTGHSWVSIADDVVDESHLAGRRRSLAEQSIASQSVADSVASPAARAPHASMAESVPDDGSVVSSAALAVVTYERERLRADLATLERYEAEREELAAAVRALQARTADATSAPTRAETDRLVAACMELTERQAGPLAALSERAELRAEPRALAVWQQLVLTDLEAIAALLPRATADSDPTLELRAAAAVQLRQALAAGAELGAAPRAAVPAALGQATGRAGAPLAPSRAADATPARHALGGSRRATESDGGAGQYYSESFAEPPSETEHYSASFCSADDDAGTDRSASTRNASLAHGGGGAGGQLRMDALLREVEAKRAEARALLASLGHGT